MEDGAAVLGEGGNQHMDLPPGFRFHPTDEELITHYLSNKVTDASFHAVAIGEVDLNKCEPWDLPSRAKMGEKEWYFFCVRDRKYPTGLRTNRATAAGYWKATGKDSAIYRGKRLLGMKKTLVFYGGRAPKGVKSNWVMHEYRLEGEYSRYNLPPKTEAKNEWVICKVFHKISSGKKPDASLLPPSTEKDVRASSTVDSAYVTCFSNATGGHDELLSEYFRSPFPCVPAELRQASPAPLFLPVMPLSNTLCSGTRFPPGAKPISCMTQRDLEISSLMSEDDDEKGRRPFDAQELAPAFTTTVGHPLHVDHCLWNY